MTKEQCLFIAQRTGALHNCYTEAQMAGGRICSTDEFYADPDACKETRYIFSTWGMPRFTRQEIRKYLPNLQAVFYAAGAVGYFAEPFLAEGIHVFSAWAANAIPVAEYTAAQIILANKGFFQLHGRYRNSHREAVDYANTFPGNYEAGVGLIGLGMISSHVIELLKPCNLDIYVCSNHLTHEHARALGVKKADMEYIFKNCQTISNHLANKDFNKGMLNYALFSLMKDNATFINTGRGQEVNEADLLRALTEKPGRTAVLDVTDPKEPVPTDDPIWKLDNVILTPHRAGSAGDEILRMGAYMMEEYHNFTTGGDTKYEVTTRMLATMA